MMHSSQKVNQALEVFLDTVTRLAHRAALEAVRSAFVSDPVPTRGHGRKLSGGSAPPSAAERRRTTAAEMEQVVACLREHPGSSARQLARHLAIDASKLRRLLRRLVANALIHIDEATWTSRGIERHGRTYTAVAAHGTAVGAPPKATQVMTPELAHTMEPPPEHRHATPLEPAKHDHAMLSEPAPAVACAVPPERPVKLDPRAAVGREVIA
jgi:hypothetical protein